MSGSVLFRVRYIALDKNGEGMVQVPNTVDTEFPFYHLCTSRSERKKTLALLNFPINEPARKPTRSVLAIQYVQV
jgi:hypothetical protein